MSAIRISKAQGTLAFTLVEVVLAIGVVTLSMLGVMALFSVGLRSDQEARDNTALATMASRVVAQLASTTNATSLQAQTATNYYFDPSGTPVAQSSASYTCTITLSKTNFPACPGASTTLAQLQFTWPPIAHPPNTNIVNASLPLSY